MGTKKQADDVVEKRMSSRRSSGDSGVLDRLYEDAKARQARLQSGEADQDADSPGRAKGARASTVSNQTKENATQELPPEASDKVAKENVANGNSHAHAEKLPEERSVALVSNAQPTKPQKPTPANKSAGLNAYLGGCMPCLGAK